MFGKRNDFVELFVDGDCCIGDFCNYVVLIYGMGIGFIIVVLFIGGIKMWFLVEINIMI